VHRTTMDRHVYDPLAGTTPIDDGLVPIRGKLRV
jgi:hypothetical protein